MDAKTTGKIIYNKRRELGLTQKELADKLNISNRAVSKWETGEGYPDISLLPELSEALQISIDELLTGKKPELSMPAPIEPSNSNKARGKLLVSEIIAFILICVADTIGCGTELSLFHVKPFYVFIEIYLLVLSFLLLTVAAIVFFTSFIKYKYEVESLAKREIVEVYLFSILSTAMPVFALYRMLCWKDLLPSYILVSIYIIGLICATIITFKKIKQNEKKN